MYGCDYVTRSLSSCLTANTNCCRREETSRSVGYSAEHTWSSFEGGQCDVMQNLFHNKGITPIGRDDKPPPRDLAIIVSSVSVTFQWKSVRHLNVWRSTVIVVGFCIFVQNFVQIRQSVVGL